MPRPLVFGNGRLLVQLDSRAQIRDLSYPIGIFNHVSGRHFRTGFWVEGKIHWTDSPGWHFSFETLGTDPLVGRSVWKCEEAGLEVVCTDWMSADSNIFHRRLTIRSLGKTREVRVFFAFAPHMLESDIGDCIYWDPAIKGLVHFKGPVALGFTMSPAPEQYACGHIGFGELEGTWKDAEDGELSMVPIAQGSVDSVMGVRLTLGASDVAEVGLQMEAADSVHWLNPYRQEEPNFKPLPQDPLDRMAAVSLAVIATQTAQTGAILASNDSDIMETNRANYSYCWMRDGANTAEELLEWGQKEPVSRYIAYAARIMRSQPQAYFLQKYRADGTLGAGWHPQWLAGEVIHPFQADETASMISLVSRATQAGVEIAQEDARALLDRPLDFLLAYRDADGMPLPSFDLWEERRGVHTYTMATIIRALLDAAAVLEDRSESLHWYAQQMTDLLCEKMFDEEEGHFVRCLRTDGTKDSTLDSSILHVGLLGILSKDLEMVARSADAVETQLNVNSKIGGIARYEGDYYFRQSEHYPGNPWLICSYWMGQHHALCGNKEAAMRYLVKTPSGNLGSGLLPEQVHPETGVPLSVCPLTWSHAEALRLVRMIRNLP